MGRTRGLHVRCNHLNFSRECQLDGLGLDDREFCHTDRIMRSGVEADDRPWLRRGVSRVAGSLRGGDLLGLITRAMVGVGADLLTGDGITEYFWSPKPRQRSGEMGG